MEIPEIQDRKIAFSLGVPWGFASRFVLGSIVNLYKFDGNGLGMVAVFMLRKYRITADYPRSCYECEHSKSNSSVKTTDCTPEISKRFRQRMFLHTIRSSLRSM